MKLALWTAHGTGVLLAHDNPPLTKCPSFYLLAIFRQMTSFPHLLCLPIDSGNNLDGMMLLSIVSFDKHILYLSIGFQDYIYYSLIPEHCRCYTFITKCSLYLFLNLFVHHNCTWYQMSLV